MKTEDIVVGRTYVCRSGPSRIRVVVLARVEDVAFRAKRRTIKFRVARVSQPGKPLPKLRVAAALHVDTKTAATHADPHRNVWIHASEIHIDHAWNARQGGASLPTKALYASLQADGQMVPVTVRPTSRDAYPSVHAPYTLTTGFRRYQALCALGLAGIVLPGQGHAMNILAYVIAESEEKARQRHTSEPNDHDKQHVPTSEGNL